MRMTIDGSSDVPNSPLRLVAMWQRQNAKIREIKYALAAAGVLTLDRQAEALGLGHLATPRPAAATTPQNVN
jgi:hypothetical protein